MEQSFSGTFGEVASFVERTWGAAYGTASRFVYDEAWLGRFFAGVDPTWIVSERDGEGGLAAFGGAVPRRAKINGADVQLGLVTLLTAARKKGSGPLGLKVTRELWRRLKAKGVTAAVHFCVTEHATAERHIWWAQGDALPIIEVAPVKSLMGLARAAPAGAAADARPPVASDIPELVDFLDGAMGNLPIRRVVDAGEVEGWIESSGKRVHIVVEGGRIRCAMVWEPRMMASGDDRQPVANLDLLVAPQATREDAARFGRALSALAFAAGAKLVIGPERPESVFPFLREAGLRLGGRVLRTLLVGLAGPVPVPEMAPHIVEVE